MSAGHNPPPPVPLQRQTSSPVFVFGDNLPSDARVFHKTAPKDLVFRRRADVKPEIIQPDPVHPTYVASGAAAIQSAHQGLVPPKAPSLLELLKEEELRHSTVSHIKPASYLRAVTSSAPAFSHSSANFQPHTHVKVVVKPETDAFAWYDTDSSATGSAETKQVNSRKSSFDTSVAKPRLLSEQFMFLQQPAPPDAALPRKPVTHAQALMRALSALSDDPSTTPSPPPLMRGHSNSSSVTTTTTKTTASRADGQLPAHAAARFERQLSSSSSKSLGTLGSAAERKLAASVIKLSRMYSIALPGKDDICFSAAVDKGPPYSRPLFVFSRFTPVLRPEAMDRLRDGLTMDAKAVLDEPNAGGNSENSEALSVEILAASQGMQLWASEMQIRYEASCPIIDYIAAKRIRKTQIEPEKPRPTTTTEVEGSRPATFPAAKPHKTHADGSSSIAPSDRKKYTVQPFANSAFFAGQRYETERVGRINIVDTGSALLHAEAAATPRAVSPDEVLVGVSVTRAMKFVGGPDAFNDEDATKLLHKKLSRLLLAREGVDPTQRWSRQILHVWAESDHVAEVLQRVLGDATLIAPVLWQRTIILCTVAPAATMHRIIFKNDNRFSEIEPPSFDPRWHEAEINRLKRADVLEWARLDGHRRK